MEYDNEPDGLYFIYGVYEDANGKDKERHYVRCVDSEVVAKSLAWTAAKNEYDYCYVEQFGVGRIYTIR